MKKIFFTLTNKNCEIVRQFTCEREARKFYESYKWECGEYLTLVCSGDVERFTITHYPNDKNYYVVFKKRQYKSVGVCETLESAKEYKAWCEKHHWSI